MLTKKDIEIIRDIVEGSVTLAVQRSEKNLREEMREITDNLRTDLRKEIKESANELKQEFAEFKDEVMGKFKHVQDDIAILAGHQDVWEDHETRITTIEKHIFTN